MPKPININGKEIKYIDRKKRRTRRVSLRVSSTGVVTASRPWWVSSSLVRSFVKEKAGWILARLKEVNQRQQNPLFKTDKQTYNNHKERARYFITTRVAQLNQRYKFAYNRIAIRNQRTVWGSCSQKRNLNFNYKLIFLPPRLADYVIVHELCHLQELNHSRKFWNLVGKTIPNYKELRKDLRNLTKNNG